MTLEVSTPALLFPAISLLFISFTNRYLHLGALVRQLHKDWVERGEDLLHAQISNLHRRITLIRQMQLFGAISLLCCVASMSTVIAGWPIPGLIFFISALSLMAASLACLCYEISISTGALSILLNAVGRGSDRVGPFPDNPFSFGTPPQLPDRTDSRNREKTMADRN